MILRCLRRAQNPVRDRFLGNFPVLLNDVQLWAVGWKIEHAQRFAAPAAKSPYGLASMPRCVVNEENESRIPQKELSRKADKSFLRLPGDETECECALGSGTDDVKPISGVIGFHDGAAAPQRPAFTEVGRDVDRALIQTRNRPSSLSIECADSPSFFLNRSCATLSDL